MEIKNKIITYEGAEILYDDLRSRQESIPVIHIGKNEPTGAGVWIDTNNESVPEGGGGGGSFDGVDEAAREMAQEALNMLAAYADSEVASFTTRYDSTSTHYEGETNGVIGAPDQLNVVVGSEWSTWNFQVSKTFEDNMNVFYNLDGQDNISDSSIPFFIVCGKTSPFIVFEIHDMTEWRRVANNVVDEYDPDIYMKINANVRVEKYADKATVQSLSNSIASIYNILEYIESRLAEHGI